MVIDKMSIGSSDDFKGEYINTSSNIGAALLMIIDYLESTGLLQAADTQLEQAITNEQAKSVQDFQRSLNAKDTKPGDFDPNQKNYLYQLENLNKDDKDYSTKASTLSNLYTSANTKNQALLKMMDGNNSTAQNVLSQNAQSQQGLLQTMGSINGVAGNLVGILRG